MKLYYVVSYPKSGATWFRTLMYSLFNGKATGSREISEFYPELPNEMDLIKKNIEDQREISFVKSHLSYSPGMDLLDKATGIIYISRHPMNVMMSKLDHYKYEGVEWVHTEEGFNRFCDVFIEEANKAPDGRHDFTHGGWCYHVKSWLKTEHNIPLVHIRYEDLHTKGNEVLRELCTTFEWNKTDEDILKAIEHSSFKNLKAIEKYELENQIQGMFYSPQRKASFESDNNNMFVRKGKKRDAYLEMPTETILRTKIKMHEAMQLTQYR